MSPRVTPIAAFVTAAAWLGGCGSSPAPSAPRAAITSTGSSPAVRCGAPAPAPGPVRPRQTRHLALPGSPDGIATTPDGQTSFVAIQSGAPRVAVIADGAGGTRLLRTVAVPAYASGMRVTPDGRYALGRGRVWRGRARRRGGAIGLRVSAARCPAGARAGRRPRSRGGRGRRLARRPSRVRDPGGRRARRGLRSARGACGRQWLSRRDRSGCRGAGHERLPGWPPPL